MMKYIMVRAVMLGMYPKGRQRAEEYSLISEVDT